MMSKILTTQLTGLLQRIEKSAEESIGDTARLLAQAGIGEGIVYFAAFGELAGVAINALDGADPFKKASLWAPHIILNSTDRIILFTRSCNDIEALTLARKLSANFVPFSAVASEVAGADNELSELATTYMSLRIRGGILPHAEKLGERIVFPHLMAALYVYEALKMEYDEMIEEESDFDEVMPTEGHASPFA